MPASLLAALLLQSTAAPAPLPPAPPAAETTKVTSYPASFFAQYRPDTALDMIQRMPGFTFDQGGGNRGFAGSEGNVRLDGQLPASRGDNMSQILRRMPAAAVERIDIVTGGAEGIDMQGQSVIANIVRKKNLGLRTTVTASETFNEDRDDAPSIRAEAQQSDGAHLLDLYGIWARPEYGNGGLRTRGLGPTSTASSYDNPVLSRDMRVTAAYEMPFAGGKVRINGVFGESDVDAPTYDTPTDATPASIDFVRNLQQVAEAGGRYSRGFGKGQTLELSVFHQLRRSDIDDDFSQGTTKQTFLGQNHQQEDILRGVVRLAPMGKWSFDGGAETAYNALRASSKLSLNGANVPLGNAKLEVEEIRGEAFATAVWTANPKFNLQAGLRFEGSTITSDADVDGEKTLTFLKPRLVATWTPAKGHLVVLRAERSIDQLSFNDFAASANLTTQTIVNGNADIEPAKNLILEARYEYRFGTRGAFTASLTHQDITDVVGRTLFVTPGGLIEASGNIGDGTRDQLYATFNTPLDSLGIKGGVFRVVYTRRWSDIIDPVTKISRTFSNDTPWEWVTNFNYEIPNTKWRGGFDTYKRGKVITFLPRETVTTDYGFIYSAFVEYRQSPTVSWRFDGLNLNDRRATYDRERYSAPRDTGVVNFRDLRYLHLDGGGRGYKVTLRKTF